MDSLVDRICTGAQLSRVYISYRIFASLTTLKAMNFVPINFRKYLDDDPSGPNGSYFSTPVAEKAYENLTLTLPLPAVNHPDTRPPARHAASSQASGDLVEQPGRYLNNKSAYCLTAPG